jgi:hypothetical protein
MQSPAGATLQYTFDEALHDILADGARTAASLGFGYRRLWATLVDATGGQALPTRPVHGNLGTTRWRPTSPRSSTSRTR